MIVVRKKIKDFITTNGMSSETAIVADCEAAGAKEEHVLRALDRMTTRGKLIKTGDNYNLA